MQVTLVAHYGEKSPRIAALVEQLQELLRGRLGLAFRPYEMEQVHGTVVGLEGCQVHGGLRNENCGMFMKIAELVDFLRGPRFESITTRIGGYQATGEYPFRSRNTHPYLRSFSIQGEIAVAMGWPVESNGFPNSLDRLRRAFQEFGVRHKWHRTDLEVDNDFFFVLGRIDPTLVDPPVVEATTEAARATLARHDGTSAEISRDTVSLVGYSDPQLPRRDSRCFGLNEPDLVGEIEALYPTCSAGAG